MVRSIKNLIAAVLISVSAYLAWTGIWPKYVVTSYLKERIEEKSDLLASRSEIVEKIEQLRNESNSKYAELQRLALVLPEKRGLPEIITAMESIYLGSGVFIPELQLGDAKSTDQVNMISITSDSTATYGQFLSLISRLEKNIRIVDLNSISVGVSEESRNAKSEDPVLTFSIKGQFYWLQPTFVKVGGSGSNPRNKEP